MSSSKRLVVAVALLASALSSAPSLAETVEQVPNPRRHGSWVTDMADVLSGTEVTLIDGAIDALERDRGAEIAVVTVRTTGTTSPKDFAHELFNRWGVGKEGVDNGVLVLLAKDDRRIEIETGYGAEGVLPDGKVGGILDRHAVPSFKRGDFGGGLVDVVNALARELRKEEPAHLRIARDAGIPIGVVVIVLLFLLGGAVVAFFVWLARRPKKCPKCERPMRLLTEEQEGAYLSREQKFEEHLGAYDWRVWRCDDDGELVFTTRGGWFSGYSDCSACGRKTARTTSHTLSYPTYSSTGLQEVITTCRLPGCQHVTRSTRILPRKQRSTTTYSSSSGWSSGSSFGGGSSSFGGGSSGGGGAGRSW